MAGAVEQALEDAVLGGLGQPPRRLVPEPAAQAVLVVGEEPVEARSITSSSSWWRPSSVMTASAQPASGASGVVSMRRPGHVLQRPVDLVVAQQVGGGDRGLGQVAGQAGGVGLVRQPGGQAGTTRARRTRSAMMSGVRKLVCTKSPRVSPNWSLRSGMTAVWGDRHPERVAEQGDDGEPVGQAADHGGLGEGLGVADPGGVAADELQDHPPDRHQDEQAGGCARRPWRSSWRRRRSLAVSGGATGRCGVRGRAGLPGASVVHALTWGRCTR